jgi:Tfp pilus assembly protein PilF
MLRRALPPLLAFGLACAHGATARDRQSAEIHHDLGVDALRAGRFPEALKEFDEAIRLDEIFSDAHRGRGLTLEWGFGKQAEAEREYRRAIELRLGYSEAHNDLGQLLARTGRLQEAVKEFDAALANMLYKEPWVARCNKGQALYQLGRKAEGLAELESCVSMSPRYCLGQRELGRLLLAEGRVQEALESFERYAKVCDKAADAWYQMGLAHLKAGDADKARQAFQKCESLGADTSLGADCRRSRELLQ